MLEKKGMVPRALFVAFLCAACSHEPLSAPPPAVPELTPSAAAHPVAPPRSFATKTIGGEDDTAVGERATNERAEGARPRRAPSTRDARPDPWSPPPLYGHKNPNPPSAGTPLYGESNPNPPGPGTPRYGEMNPNPPGPRTPRYGESNPSPPGR